MKCCNAKELRLASRVQLQSPVAGVRDASGQKAVTWTQEASPACHIRQLTGSEQVNANQLYGRATHLVTMRYMPGVSINWRLVYDGREFAIGRVNDIEERKQWIELTCAETIEAS